MQRYLDAQLEKFNIDGMYITSPVNIRYLTGFDGSFGVVIIIKGEMILVTDKRYFEEAIETCKDTRVIEVQDHEWEHIVSNLKNMVFEADHMTVHRFEKLQQKFHHVNWIPATPIIEDARRRKNAFELTAITQACSIGDTCLEEVVKTIKAGDTEIEIALRLERIAMDKANEKISFPVIVAFEGNAAIPHHKPTQRPLQKGDTILIDYGVSYHGYCSDMSRTFFFQAASSEKRAMYDIVLKAQEIGRNAMQINRRCTDAYTNVHNFFLSQGLDKYFTHSLGHGVGIEIHESPNISKTSQEQFIEWETVTCEPGLYLPGKFGIRIEDLGIVKKTGYEVLTKTSKELRIIK